MTIQVRYPEPRDATSCTACGAQKDPASLSPVHCVAILGSLENRLCSMCSAELARRLVAVSFGATAAAALGPSTYALEGRPVLVEGARWNKAAAGAEVILKEAKPEKAQIRCAECRRVLSRKQFRSPITAAVLCRDCWKMEAK